MNVSDLTPGQDVIVTHITFDGVTMREHGRVAIFMGLDGGHAMVRYADGTREVLWDNKRIKV